MKKFLFLFFVFSYLVFIPSAISQTCSPCFSYFAYAGYSNGILKLVNGPRKIAVIDFGNGTKGYFTYRPGEKISISFPSRPEHLQVKVRFIDLISGKEKQDEAVIHEISSLPVLGTKKGIIINSTSDVIVQMGSFVFLVESHRWFSNFSNSFYSDDPYGNNYLIIESPPDGEYKVSLKEGRVIILNYKVVNGELVTSEVIRTDREKFSFKVKDSEALPLSEGILLPALRLDKAKLLIIGFGVIGAIVLIIFLKKKRKEDEFEKLKEKWRGKFREFRE